MLVWLALGGLALLGVLALLQGFARASVTTVRTGLIAAGVTLALLLAAGLLASGRAPQALATLTLVAPLLWTGWQGWRTARRFSRGAAGGSGGGASSAGGGTEAGAGGGETQVETATLTMTLRHASGRMTGRVRRGRFAGAELADLGLAELLALLEECRLGDTESVPLLEAWLDRAQPDWRAAAAAEAARARAGRDAASPGRGRMDRAEALAVLGLSEGATEEEIRAAHRRLMRAAHPDRGGSDWIAARLNEARDTLLREGAGRRA